MSILHGQFEKHKLKIGAAAGIATQIKRSANEKGEIRAP